MPGPAGKPDGGRRSPPGQTRFKTDGNTASRGSAMLWWSGRASR